MDPPAHTPLRKLAGQAFSPSVTRSLEPRIKTIVAGLLDEIMARGREFDFVAVFAAYVPVSVTAELLNAANHDERRFADPDRFDIHCDARQHLSVAHGPHYWPGAALGKTLGAIALEAVMERMPDLHRLDDHTDWLPSLWIRGARTLPVAY